MKIKTKDLWQSAYVLAKGGELEQVSVEDNGRREVYFTLSGPDVNDLGREFLSGQAVVNISRLRASMIHLKDQIFQNR